MAPTVGCLRKSVSALSFVYLTFFFMPYASCMMSGMSQHRLCVPHHSNKGFIVTKLLPHIECVEMDVISKLSGNDTNPFHIDGNGYLVTSTTLSERIHDIYTIKTSSSCSSSPISPVSDGHQIYIEIVGPGRSITFLKDRYTGTISRTAREGTVVDGLEELSACIHQKCESLAYSIKGKHAEYFHIRVILKDGKELVEILTKTPLVATQESKFNFIITAEDLSGAQGHTNVEINVLQYDGLELSAKYESDQNLRFQHHRHKRQTSETYPDQTFPESVTGPLFSIAPNPPNPDWRYSLKSSTLENMFEVGVTSGQISVISGGKLDYDSDPTKRTITLVITVSQNNIDVKDIQVVIHVEDVNDENPVFINEPVPYLAAVSAQPPANTLVYTLTAMDPDAGANLQLEGDLTDAQKLLFVVNMVGSDKAEIRTLGSALSLDTEYNIRVLASDTNAPTGTTQRTIANVLVKAGERSPQFMKQTYALSFQEGNVADQVITTTPIRAISFQGVSQLIYLILNSQLQESTLFKINPAGNIRVTKEMDYEDPDERLFNLFIRAMESETNLYSDVQLTVTVTDYNEAAPRFRLSLYESNPVPENVPVGTVLMRVTATDDDYNEVITFGVDNGNFRVENTLKTSNGTIAVIAVNKELDYDRIPTKLYEFHLTATDDGSLPRSGVTTIIVSVTNVNDEAPLFPVNETAGRYMSVGIPYDSEAGFAVYTVRATDADLGDRITYRLDPANQFNGLFTLSAGADQGLITLSRKIADNQADLTVFKYELRILAVDDGACCGMLNQKTSTGTVTINILTENIHSPDFATCNSYKPEVDENAVDAFIIQVQAQDADFGINGEVTYKIRGGSNYFRINETTGQLFTTAQPIDRESIGGAALPVNIEAKDGGGYEGLCPIMVTINDVNDNAPVFVPPSGYAFTVKNDQGVGGKAGDVQAEDVDIGPNGDIVFSLVSNPGDYFMFDEYTRQTGRILVAKELPQQQTRLTLIVQATDEGNPPLATNTTVIIDVVENANELPPRWVGTDADYTVTIDESVAKQTAIVTLRAQSQIDNKNLVFSVIGDANKERFIAVDGTIQNDIDTGTLKNSEFLDYETTSSYQIAVRAYDVFNRYADQTVTVNLRDDNDEIPHFLGVGNSTWIEISLAEGDYSVQAVPEFVFQLQAVDDDKTIPNNQIEGYNLTTADDRFVLNPITGRLTTTGVFDRESVPKDTQLVYTLGVEAYDSAPSSLPNTAPRHNTGVASVRLTIIDVNDNSPDFPQASYTFSVDEDRPNGDDVGTMTADDQDSDAKLLYQMQTIGPVTIPFTIQPQTGVVKVAGPMDYDEGIKQYNFTVTVFDQINYGSADVTINILDVNDNPPKVNDYTFTSFTENDYSIVGVIETITATDIDNNGQNTFYYSLSFTDQKDAEFFEINRLTGELSIKKPLDRDLPNGKAEFQFIVDVADAQVNPLIGRGKVTVSPIDVNDNAPFFPTNKLQMEIMENKVPDSWVGDVVVTDYDAGVNAQYDLRLVSQGPEEHFNLTSTGSIVTTAKLDREAIDTYYIIIEAKDKGTPRLSGSGTLTVSVLDANDNAPYFNRTYSFVLPEEQHGGRIGLIQAYDLDIGINADLTYRLADTEDKTYFQMTTLRETNQGELTVFSPIDYDLGSKRFFNLTVNASDSNPGDYKENHAQTFIYITITDGNDEIPKFANPTRTASVSEDALPGKSLAVFNATDNDVNPAYGFFTYHIEQKSDPMDQFAINQNGLVTVKHELDRETVALHIIHILAIDNPTSMPQNTGTATLTVTVLDVNDNFPDFAQSIVPTIKENVVYTNGEVTTFSAKDADTSDNGPPFTFELRCIQGSQCNKFELIFNQQGDSGNGEGTIRVSGEFDREKESLISLPIYMCDSGVPVKCGTRNMEVKVTDEDDVIHSEGNQVITVYNYKGLFGNIPIGEVNIEDPDVINEGKIYTLLTTEASHYISLNSASGVITLLPDVPPTTFTFLVEVEGKQKNIRTSAVTVIINYITDDAVFSSGSVRFQGITDEEFLRKEKKNTQQLAYEKSMYEEFRALLATKLGTDIENVHCLSVMYNPDRGDHTDVRCAAHGSPWYQSSKLDGLISLNRDEFQNLLGDKGQLGMVPIDMCQQENCEGGCYNKLVVSDKPKLVNSHGASFVGVNTDVQGACGCRATDHTVPIECRPGYCYHGGSCVKDAWDVVRCDCPEGFEGPRCQQLRHTFNGTGYALFKPLEQCENSRTSIEILTNKADGLILYNGPHGQPGQGEPRDFILLELAGGVPRLRINHGTGELSLTIQGSNPKLLNDGAWHRIDIHRTKKVVKLVVDHCDNSIVDSNHTEDRSNCEAHGVTPGENIYINVDEVLELGGRRPGSSYPNNVMTQKFDGCMKNLRHNTELYDLNTGDVFPGSRDGCKREDDACGATPNYCGNGRCLITGVGSSMCDCDPGWRISDSDVCDTETVIRDFKEDSYLDWRLKNSFIAILNSRNTAVSFRYRTRDAEGLMFSVTDRNQNNRYIKLKIDGSRLQATYNLGDGPITVSLSQVPASDGQWHQVRLERYGKELMLKMDSGEGLYYTESLGPEIGKLDFYLKNDEIYSGVNLLYDDQGIPAINRANEQDFVNSCINDVRVDRHWFPMTQGEEAQSFSATLEREESTSLGCVRDDCQDQCPPTFVCVPLWEAYACNCKDFYIKNKSICVVKDFCADNPCVTGTCINENPCTNANSAECNNPLDDEKQYFTCECPEGSGWYGNLCQCNAALQSAGAACVLGPTPEPAVSMAGGVIAAIILGILLFIVAIIIIAWLLFCRRKPVEKEPFEDDPDDDIRENIMYYDEEGAGEEDQTGYDLSRLRKPDDGEHPKPWDATDIPKSRVKPLGATSDRPDIGDFINNRLDDADDDPNSPPYDTPIGFDFEGGGSSVGSLSSLNTSSSGDQDYDYLNEWGPKFAKLADMYNNYDETQ